MIPASFDYEVATSVDHAKSLLKEGGEDARLLAGGHSLLPMMRLRLARPSLLIDIGRLKDLSYVNETENHIAIGALTRHHDVNNSDVLAQHCPLLAYTAGLVGDPQVRHRGTIGGSVSHGDAASDLPTALLALEAEFVVSGDSGDRIVAAADFFTGIFTTALQAGELLTEIRVPKCAANHGWSYVKFNRRAQDWAIVGVATVIDRANGTISRGAVGLTNMGRTPLRATAVEAALAGADVKGIEAAAAKAAEGTSPPSDTNGSAEYRKHLVTVLTRRALVEALGR